MPGLGDAFLLETPKVLKLIEQFPQAWHPLTAEIRRCRLKRFPYGVVYTLDAADILVLAEAYQHRKPGYWRDRALPDHWPCVPKPFKDPPGDPRGMRVAEITTRIVRVIEVPRPVG